MSRLTGSRYERPRCYALTGIGSITVGLGLVGLNPALRLDLTDRRRELLQPLGAEVQLTEARIPALKILANTFGTTTAAMQDMVTKGLVPADKAIPALLAGIEHGTNGIAGQTARFGGLMRKQSHTLGGVISNLKDTVSTGLAQAVKPLVPVLERQIPRATKAQKAAKEAAESNARALHALAHTADQAANAAEHAAAKADHAAAKSKDAWGNRAGQRLRADRLLRCPR